MIAVFPLVLGGAMALTGAAGFQVLFGVEVGVAMRIFFRDDGLGTRLIGIAAHGTPNLMSLGLIGIELTGAPMWLWHRRILRQRL